MLFGYSLHAAFETLRWIARLLIHPPSISKRTLVVAGISLNIFSLASAAHSDSHKPVAVLFLLHGRISRAKHVALVAKAFLDELQIKTQDPQEAVKEKCDLWIVTFDHRNHGTRLVDKHANHSWSKSMLHGINNDRHALDMYAIQTGTAHDVSFLIDFLPSYLFPNRERTISQWLVSGISLGGHSTWIVLKNEPRITLGIPIIGCPDYLALMSRRAQESSIPIEPPYFPKSFLQYVEKNDPASTPHTVMDTTNPYRGKKILILAGKEDDRVPWSAFKKFVEELDVGEQEGGVKEVFIDPAVGHTCSPTMVQRAVRFLWENALTTNGLSGM